jgi:hypothetical protein
MRTALVIAMVVSQGCSEFGRYIMNDVRTKAVAAVRAELAQASDVELRTTGKHGEGLYVYSVDRSGNPEFVWLFVHAKQLFAIGTEELALTPRVPLLGDANDHVRHEVELIRVSRQEILDYLRSRREGEYVSHALPGKDN